MARLPVPGQDDGEWGDILNEFLLTSHDNDGTLKTDSVDGTSLQDATVTNTKLNANVGSDGQVLTRDATQVGGFSWASAGTGGTNLSSDVDSTQVTIASDTGTDAVIGSATPADAGVMSASDKTKLNGIEAGAEANDVTSVAGKTGAVLLDGGDVGLANVDNTSDANKPVSTAQQTALDLKANLESPTFTGTPITPALKITGGTPAAGKVLTSDADGDATWEAASGGSGPTGFYSPGRWYDGQLTGYSGTSSNISELRIAYSMIVPLVTQSFDAIGLYILGGAPGTMRLGVYAALSSGGPGALLFDSGDIDVTTSGGKTAALSLTLTGGMAYYLAAFPSSSGLTVPAIPIYAAPNYGVTSLSDSTPDTYVYSSSLHAYGPLPNPAETSFEYADVLGPPAIRLKAV